MAPACGGPAQSPINIDLHLVQRDPTLGPFIFQGYNSAPASPWTLENNGHTGQYLGPGTATTTPPRHPDRSRNHLGVGTTCPSPPSHTQGSKSPQSAQEHPYMLVKTPPTGNHPPTIAISHCPLGLGIRTFPEVRECPPQHQDVITTAQYHTQLCWVKTPAIGGSPCPQSLQGGYSPVV